MLTLIKLTRNGNSVTLTIPRPALAHLGWLPGEHVALAIDDDRSIRVIRVDVAKLIAASAPADEPTATAAAVV